MTSVLTVGITAQEIVLQVSNLPVGGSKTHARERHLVTGGTAANAAVAIARLGGHSILSTCLGNDVLAEQIVADLTESRVDTQAVEWVNGGRTSLSAVIVDAGGERMRVTHADPLLFQGPPRDYHDLDVRIDAVMTDTCWPGGADAALDFAERAKIPCLVNFDRIPEISGEMFLSRASHVVLDRQALIDVTGETTPSAGLRQASSMGGAWLAVTAGSDGVYWLDGRKLHHLPAYEIEAVDTLGASDVFHGALALALAENRPIPESIRFAAAAAAIKCQTLGGGRGAPTRGQVDDFTKKRSV